MLQHTNNPLSNHHIFRPVNTGSPRQDLYNHLSRLPQSARIDFEAHTVSGNLIIRIEPDLGSASEQEAEAKIVSVPYAERALGNLEDAVEFIRSVKLIAGCDARAFNLQLIASHYYKEARTRPACEVLKEMALLAMQLSAVTAMEEERQFDETIESLSEQYEDVTTDSHLSISDRRALSLARAAQVLGETEEDISLFDLECRAAAPFRSHASGLVTDEFAAYLAEQETSVDSIDEVDALFETYEAVYEQYDEDGVVSLHMTDGERVVVAGSLDDDIDESCLPEDSRHLAGELYDLYTNGFPLRDCGEALGVEGVTVSRFQRDSRTGKRSPVPVMVYGLDTWLDSAVDAIFYERVTRTTRNFVLVPQQGKPCRQVVREEVIPRVVTTETTRRGVTNFTQEVRHTLRRIETSVIASRLHEQTSTIEVCPHSDERETTRAVLEVLLDRMKAGYHTRGLHTNTIYRRLATQLNAATDTASVARLKKEAWEHKEQKELSVKLFTAFNTWASVRQATLESEPHCERRTHRVMLGAGFTMTQTYANGERKFIVAQPLLNRIELLTGRTLEAFAIALHELPRQEKERVRVAFQKRNPHLYARVRDGLRAELLKSSEKKLRYFRWAFYANNKPGHPVHTLTREDQSGAWELLKHLSRSDAAPSVEAPLIAIAEAAEEQARRMSAVA